MVGWLKEAEGYTRTCLLCAVVSLCAAALSVIMLLVSWGAYERASHKATERDELFKKLYAERESRLRLRDAMLQAEHDKEAGKSHRSFHLWDVLP